MKPSRVDQILKDWAAVAAQAPRPAAPPRPVVVRSGLSTLTLAGAGLAAAALVIATVWLAGQGPNPNGSVGGSPSTSPTSTSATTPTPVPTPGPCDPASLSARITMWEGAAGHR
ncbi:MAG: hypothetical protein M3R57_04005, partial [Chloroflexota bacterium]|nr:hypothetical protein [Chloroflexota bacterium]